MHSPYENVIIGNFLYSLGLAMGTQPRPSPGCVNLLQQTPLDPVLGDVMVHLPGVWRLIEFKRKGADLDKETAKLLLVHGALKNRPLLTQISRKVHWFVESDAIPSRTPEATAKFMLDVCPYLDLLNPKAPQTQLNLFTQSMISEAFETPDASLVRENRYLKLIQLLHGRRDFNTSGLLVGVSSAGGLTYVPVPNFADLRGTASMLRDQMQERWHDSQRIRLQSVEQKLGRTVEKHLERAIVKEKGQEITLG